MTDYSSNPFGARIDWNDDEVQNRASQVTKGAVAVWDENGTPEMRTGTNGQILILQGGNPTWGTGTGVTAPVGGVIAWLKSYTNTPALPDGWVECNGQTLSDGDSVYNGQTIPNLNASGGGEKRFLRGSTTSGTTGGADSVSTGAPSATSANGTSGSTPPQVPTDAHTHSVSTLSAYYEVVWIMRVK